MAHIPKQSGPKECASENIGITCPNCNHTHEVAREYFSKVSSRLLKCADCANVWRYHVEAKVDQLPPAYMPTSPSAFQSPPPLPSHVFEMRENTSQSSSFPEPPRLTVPQYKRPARFYHWDWWVFIIGAIIAVIVLIQEVGPIPSLNWFYEQAYDSVTRVRQVIFPSEHAVVPRKGVILQVLTSKLSGDADTAILHVQCEVINDSDEAVYLPPVNISIFDKNEAEDLVLRTSWQHTFEEMPIKPGVRKIFETTAPCLKNVLPSTIEIAFERK